MRLSAYWLVSVLLGVANVAAPAEAAAPPAHSGKAAVPTQLPRSAKPVHYTLSVKPDAVRLAFRADALIDLMVVRPTEVITLNAVEIRIQSASLVDREGANIPVTTSLDPERQTLNVVTTKPLLQGRYRLRLRYQGKIQTQPFGLFARDYESEQGADRALFTQFEPADARRVLPSWDEPNFRVPIDLHVTVPEQQSAVSNMPEKAVVRNPDGTKTVAFATTPPISTYLLFFGVGNFDRITAPVGDAEMGVVTRAGAAGRGKYALDSAAELLAYYNRYFGIPYPLPKLDNVAAPGSGQFFNAMENWGAIFTFEDYLLSDPAITSESRRQQIFSAMAHEMGHQWFGNLVTMAWWDDLWLNEGFASWLANKATEQLHPEWEPLLDRIRSRELGMEADSLPETHPIVQHISKAEQISEAFDDITYSKGEAVIVMLEGYVGAEAWRKGVSDYLRTYRLRNTVTDNLWEKIAQAADKPVTAIAHDFTLQPGVPLIRVESAECVGGHMIATLRQDEFRRKPIKARPGHWRVPVNAAVLGGGNAQIVVQDGLGRLEVPGCGTLLVNQGQTGYYRTLYTPELRAQLAASYARLNSMDRLGLLADSWSLGLAGYQPVSEALRLVDAIPSGSHPDIWKKAASILRSVHAMLRGDPEKQAMVARYATAKLYPELERVGWDPRAGEKSQAPVLRAELIGALGAFADPKVVAEAKRRFALLESNRTALDGPLRGTILEVVAANADQKTWDRLRDQAKAERVPLLRGQLYNLLATAHDETLARRALALALTDEPGSGIRSRMIETVGRWHPELAYDFAVEHRSAVQGLVDSFSLASFIPDLARGSFDPDTARKLSDYAERYMTPTSRIPADAAASTVKSNVQVKEARLADIARWFEAKSGGSSARGRSK